MTGPPAQQNMTVRNEKNTVHEQVDENMIKVAVRVRPLSSTEKSSGKRSCCKVVGTQVSGEEEYPNGVQ